MQEHGENPERGTRALSDDLVRLRRAGLADLAVRPDRYPTLSQALVSAADPPRGLLPRLAHNGEVFAAVVAQLPTDELRRAARVLFHVQRGTTPPPLDQRRRAADRIFTGRDYAREPDTIQRHLEREVLDPMLIEIISGGAAAIVEPVGDGGDFDAWADDLDRVNAYLNRQDFTFASSLLDRWIGRAGSAGADRVGRALLARSLVLYGNMQRDQGVVVGPMSARKAYTSAMAVLADLGNQRRIAQAELLLAVVNEMTGDLDDAARSYRQLADDPRLTPLERARARLWLGTTLTKQRDLGNAMSVITTAADEFDALDEPDEWSVAHQKLALGHLAAGDQGRASRYIERALTHRRHDSPLQQVRLDTAHGHILISDPGTRASGEQVLDTAETTATRYGLSHQVRSIHMIRRSVDTR